MTRKVWIDWNQNGSFTDNGEEVLVEDNATTLSYTGTFYSTNKCIDRSYCNENQCKLCRFHQQPMRAK
jgi:hypothetical protein